MISFPLDFQPEKTFFMIMGLGKSGWALGEFLDKQGLSFGVWDDAESCQQKAQEKKWTLFSPQDLKNIPLQKKYKSSAQGVQENPSIQDFRSFSPFSHYFLILSPGISPKAWNFLQEEGPWTIMGDVQLFFLFFPHIKALGVTGSNGKSTLCKLLYEGFQQKGIPCVLGGNIGTPLFSLAPPLLLSYTDPWDDHDPQEHDTSSGYTSSPSSSEASSSSDPLYILELSSYQLETCFFLPLLFGVVLNVHSHHLERHGSLENYKNIKGKIFSHSVLCFLPKSLDSAYRSFLEQKPCFFLPEGDNISPKDQASFILEIFTFMVFGGQELFFQDNAFQRYREKEDFMTKVRHFFSPSKSLFQGNPTILQDLSKKYFYDFPFSSSLLSPPDFSSFVPLAHRQEVFAQTHHVTFVNDSKATNPKAASFALRSWASSPLFWLVGGSLQQDDLEDLFPSDGEKKLDSSISSVESSGATLGSRASLYFPNVRHVFAFGESAHHWASFLLSQGFSVSVFPSLESALLEATEQAFGAQDPSVVVLLSPGSSSFDEFSNFEHRGSFFKKNILEILYKKKRLHNQKVGEEIFSFNK